MESEFDRALSHSMEMHNIDFMLKPLQKKVLEILVTQNEDVLTILPTGFGKSLIYSLLPSVLDAFHNKKGSIVLVISPLVALMQDQVTQIEKLGISCAYLGSPDQSDDIRKRIEGGNIPVLLTSPESLFTTGGNMRRMLSSPLYREKLSAIVVDEAHCVEQWGDEFRTDYSRIAELRSIIPDAVMLALTATASVKSRKNISHLLSMNQFQTVVGCSDRPNIAYFCEKASPDMRETFLWLIDELKFEQNKTPKCIIYCRNIKACALLYVLFMKEIGPEMSYLGRPSAKNCLYAMFHRSTPEKNKRIVMENFKNEDSTQRVVIATTAFGLGINVPDVRRVLHWGASRSMSGFMQESGRAGRDNIPAHSVVYFHPVDISKVATEQEMSNYCTLLSCRRQFLINHFSPDAPQEEASAHPCCDVCLQVCACDSCSETYTNFLHSQDDKLLFKDAEESDMLPYRNVSDAHKSTIKTSLQQLRSSMVDNIAVSILNTGLLTGLSNKVIDDLVSNSHYILSVEDVLSEYVFDYATADSVMKVIESVISEE